MEVLGVIARPKVYLLVDGDQFQGVWCEVPWWADNPIG